METEYKGTVSGPFIGRVCALSLFLALGACQTFRTADNNISANEHKAEAGLAQLRNYPPASVETIHNVPFLLGAEVSTEKSPDGKDDPVFDQHFPIITGSPLSLDQVAALIAQQSGVPVNVSTQVDGFLNGTQGQSSQVTMPPLPGQSGKVSAPLPSVSPSQNQLSISWNGSLRGLLNLIAAKTGTFWKYSNGTVQFYLTETRVFAIDALPGSMTMSASISNAGSSGSTSSSSGAAGQQGSTEQSAGLTATLDTYTSVQNGINTILAETQSAGGSGTNINVPTSVAEDQTGGDIIVTATPPELDQVAQYIRSRNQELAKNVAIDIHIYSVTLNDQNNYGLNLSAAFNAVAERYGLNFTSVSPPTAPTGEGSISAEILSAPAAGQGGLTTPTQGIVEALATQGNVSLDTDGSVLAMNGVPTPLQVAQNHAYVASSATTTAVNAGTSTTLTPGNYTVGFSGTFLPLVRANQILLEYNVNLTQDLGLQSFTSNGTEVQLPQVAGQSFMQRVALHSGETLVLSGFEQANDQTNATGTGIASFWGLGGGKSATHEKQALVVVIHVQEMGS